MSSPTSELVLVTGGTGFVGFAVIRDLLRAGHRVRAIVRSTTKATVVKSVPSIQPHLSSLSFTIIPDLTTPNALTSAAADCTVIQHLAGPIVNDRSYDDFDAEIVQPILAMTRNVLLAADANPGVKRVVIASSIAGLVPATDFGNFTTEICRADQTTPECDRGTLQGPYANMMHAYSVAKWSATYSTRDFLAEKQRGFDVVHTHPVYVFGAPELAKTPAEVDSGTNIIPMGVILGRKAKDPEFGVSVHIDDVAALHVVVMDRDKVKGGEHFAAMAEGPDGLGNFERANEIVQKTWPQEVKSGVLKADGKQETMAIRLDGSKAEKLLGRRMLGYEEQVKSLVGYYLDILGKETK